MRTGTGTRTPPTKRGRREEREGREGQEEGDDGEEGPPAATPSSWSKEKESRFVPQQGGGGGGAVGGGGPGRPGSAAPGSPLPRGCPAARRAVLEVARSRRTWAGG